VSKSFNKSIYDNRRENIAGWNPAQTLPTPVGGGEWSPAEPAAARKLAI